MKRILSALRITILFIALFFLNTSSRVPFAKAETANTISVSPPTMSLFGNPGDTLSESLKVGNNSNGDLVYTVSVVNFTAQGDEGSVEYLEEGTTNSFSLAKWVNVTPTKFTVAANQEKIINFSIKIPKDAEPGGHYASIVTKLASQTAIEGSGASVQSDVGSLVLLRVSGNITEDASIVSFKTDNFFYKSTPVKFELKTKNNGNVHIAPEGTIVITNIFGKKVAEIPLNKANVLPGAERIVNTVFDGKKLLGHYNASLVSSYGENKKIVSASTSFIVIPPMFAGVMAVIIILIVLLITQRKKLKKLINSITSD